MRWEKGCCYYHTINVGKVFRHFNHFSISTNAEQNLLHTVLNWSYILTRLSKSLLSGIFKSWRDHHNIPYFYVHILYQIVGFIHYKDGINKRRRIKRSFIVEIVLDLASALKSHSQTKNTLNSVPLLTLLSATWSWSNQFFTSLLKHYPSKILLKHYQSKIVKKH